MICIREGPRETGTLGKLSSHFDPVPNEVGDRTTTLRRLLIGAERNRRVLSSLCCNFKLLLASMAFKLEDHFVLLLTVELCNLRPSN